MSIDRATRRQLLADVVSGLSCATIGTASTASSVRLATQTPHVSSDPEILFEVTFPRDWQPEGKAQGAFYRITLEPEQSLAYLPGPYCGCSGETIQEGTAAERVMSGTYTVELDRSFIIRRNDGDDDEIEAETEVQSTSGEVAIDPDAMAFGRLMNAGDETIRLYGASITSLEIDVGTVTPVLPEEMSTRLSVAVYDAWHSLGNGDIITTLTLRTLAPVDEIAPYPIAGLEAIHVEQGELHSSLIRPGESGPTADPLYVRAGGTVAFRNQTPGTQLLLANPFEEPATLLTLTFARTE